MNLGHQNKIQEKEGIEFLRSLINTEPAILPDGRPDLGWCCFEHSNVASMAFAAVGIKAFRCNGKVIIGNFRERLYNDVLPHSFVLLEAPRVAIFDSAVTFNSIRGIPIGFSHLSPDLGVGLLNEKPTEEPWHREGTLAGKPTYALYGIQNKQIPDGRNISWINEAPFGKWLTATFGSQKGLWAKAAWCTAQIFAGNAAFAFKGVDKRQLWEFVSKTTDRDDFILDRLNAIR